MDRAPSSLGSLAYVYVPVDIPMFCQLNNLPRTNSLKKWGCELYSCATKASQGAQRNIFSAELFP